MESRKYISPHLPLFNQDFVMDTNIFYRRIEIMKIVSLGHRQHRQHHQQHRHSFASIIITLSSALSCVLYQSLIDKNKIGAWFTVCDTIDWVEIMGGNENQQCSRLLGAGLGVGWRVLD